MISLCSSSSLSLSLLAGKQRSEWSNWPEIDRLEQQNFLRVECLSALRIRQVTHTERESLQTPNGPITKGNWLLPYDDSLASRQGECLCQTCVCALRVICINYARQREGQRKRTRAEVEAALVAGDIAEAGAKLLCSAIFLSLCLSLYCCYFYTFPTDRHSISGCRFSRCFVRLHFHKHVLGFETPPSTA